MPRMSPSVAWNERFAMSSFSAMPGSWVSSSSYRSCALPGSRRHNRIATSQIALPEPACNSVYATTGYSQSVLSLKQISLQRDNVFGDDGGVHELGTVTGDVTNGMTVTLNVPVKNA